MSTWGDFAASAGSSLFGTALGLATQDVANRNSYKWGEKAAKSDFARQMEMYERQYKDRSPLNIVNQLKEAGLNKSLMFSGGAGGVGGAASGATAPQNKMGFANAQQGINLALTAAQLRNMRAQTANIEADTQKKSVEAENIKESTTTNVETREAIKNKLFEEGHGKFLENFQNLYKMNPKKDGEDYEMKSANYYGTESTRISSESLFTQEITSTIAKTLAETGNSTAQALLTNKKAEGYFTELLNDTIRADSAKIQATAQKLASEWNTGEFTNWKTWADLASKAISTLK